MSPRSALAAGVRAAIPADTPALLRMHCAPWLEARLAEYCEKIVRYFAGEASLLGAAFIAFDATGALAYAAQGFTEVEQLRCFRKIL